MESEQTKQLLPDLKCDLRYFATEDETRYSIDELIKHSRECHE